MTIRWYATASELDGASDHTRKAGRYEMTILYRQSANSRRRAKVTSFTVCGQTDAACDAHAVYIAETIAFCSLGVIGSLKKIMGHYRKDEEAPVVAVNRRVWGVQGYSPDPEAGDDIEALNMKIFVPLFDKTKIANLADLVEKKTYSGEQASVGVVRWGDQAQTVLRTEGLDMTDRGVGMNDMTRMVDEELISDDVSAGIADGVLGPQDPNP